MKNLTPEEKTAKMSKIFTAIGRGLLVSAVMLGIMAIIFSIPFTHENAYTMMFFIVLISGICLTTTGFLLSLKGGD